MIIELSEWWLVYFIDGGLTTVFTSAGFSITFYFGVSVLSHKPCNCGF